MADRTVRIWDVATGALIETLVGHVDLVLDLAYSPDGAQLASAAYDRTVRIWDVATGQSRTLRGHQGAIHAVAWLDDAKLVTGSVDGTVRVWPVPSTETPTTAALRQQIDEATSAVVGAGEQVASPRAE
jgi:WD40 repeat protein